MSKLDTVTDGITPAAPRILIYGTEGVGKSTWASTAPAPIFISTEDGLNAISAHKFPLSTTFEDVMLNIAALYQEQHEYRTCVIDSITALESLIAEDVCKTYRVKTLLDIPYGKGKLYALYQWRVLLANLTNLNKCKNMTIVLIGHTGTQEVKDPETATYDRTAPRLDKAACSAICEWCDCVFQAKQKFKVSEEQGKFGADRTRAVAIGAQGGERVIRAIGNAAVIAKNRYNLPEELPLSNFSAIFNFNSTTGDKK